MTFSKTSFRCTIVCTFRQPASSARSTNRTSTTIESLFDGRTQTVPTANATTRRPSLTMALLRGPTADTPNPTNQIGYGSGLV